MTRLCFFILSVLLGLLSAMAAEPAEFRGSVIDAETGEPLAGAIIKAKGAFTTTDADGNFALRVKEGADTLSVRCMGYETLKLAVNDKLNPIRLNPVANQLHDVIVEAPDIFAKGDTLVFNVDKYANAKDNAIIDVIKRLPGIKVEEDGTIKYQGKPINKFYLDGNDFIGGQYGLATNNISYKDVKSVEVLEKHQPVKALEGIEFPEEAGINLKLKEDARDRWVGVAKASAGAQPLLYGGSLFTMRMASKMQNMFTLKADNSGWNPANEIREHDFDDMFSSEYSGNLWPEYISADMAGAPLTEKRTRDNLSWLANSISAWRKGDTSMRLKLNYMADRLDYKSSLATEYLDSHLAPFVQQSAMRSQIHDLSAQFYGEINKRGYYLKDKLTVDGAISHSHSAVTGSRDLDQSVDRKKFEIQNDLKLVKRNEQKLFTLISRNSFSRRPDALAVDDQHRAAQTIGMTDLRSTTETRVGRMHRFWRYFATLGFDLDWHRMDAALNGLGAHDNSGAHNALLTNLYASPRIEYNRSGWRLALSMPIKWLHHDVGGSREYLNLSPSFSAHRQLTAKSELSTSLSYRLGSPQAYLNIKVPLMADYRDIFIAANPDGYSHDWSATVSYRYRNPIKALFVNISAAYAYSRSSFMRSQDFEGDYIISSYADRLWSSDTWRANGGISKGLGHSKMVIGCDFSGSLSTSSSMRDGVVIPYRQTFASAKPYVKGSITKWLSASYEGESAFSRLSVDGDVSNSASLRQNLHATVAPADNLQFTIGGEHFLTRLPEGACANLVLIDASAVWRPTHKLRLSLTADNMLNKRQYRYTTFGTLSRSTHAFTIRPRTILATLQYSF